jgi:uncharacterized membrane protein YccC
MQIAPALFTIPRRLGVALFRIHIENGLAVSLGMAAVGLGTALCFGRDIAIQAAIGALCASVVDQPGPQAIKTRMFALAIGGTAALTVLTILARETPWVMGLLVAAMSFVTGLISAYGRRAIGLGVAAVLAMLFGMMAPASIPMLWHTAIFAAGGIGYAGFALLMATVLDDRNRRLFLGEAIRAFGAYVAAKAELYDPLARPRLAEQVLIEAHAVFVERLQAARDTIFTGKRTSNRMRWMAALISLLDCIDFVLSSDADIETLRQSVHRHLLRRLGALIADIAENAQELALALVTPGATVVFAGHESQLQAIGDEVQRLEHAAAGGSEPLELSAFRSTWHKLAQTISRLKRLTEVIDASDPAQAKLPNVDLSLFRQIESMDPRLLLAQMTPSSPVLRYAIRLTLAMSCGYAVMLILPNMLHGGWVLLTTMLIMRASYSITRQRRNDRIVGTVIGCVVAAVLVHVLPRDWLFLPMLVTVGSAHAFAAVDFRITALSASITALLSLHFLAPETGAVFFERIFDTLIGAGLAWSFSFLLPSWEWRNVGNLVTAKVGADRKWGALALARQRDDQAYRLARKQAHDATANLSMTVRRLVDEPQVDRRTLVALNDLLGANYMFASDLASMRVLFRLRAGELEPAVTDALLETARTAVALALGAPDATDAPVPRLSRRSRSENLGGPNAMISLRRRLVHIERTAERVAALAAKVVKSD